MNENQQLGWQPCHTAFIQACIEAGVIPMRSDVERCLEYAKQLDLKIEDFPPMPRELCIKLAQTTVHPIEFWLVNWGGGNITRAHLFSEARRIAGEIEQMFTDADHWNRYVRKEGEETINPDPDGTMSRLRAKMLKFLEQEKPKPGDPFLRVVPAAVRISWCPAFGAGRTVEHLWSAPFLEGGLEMRECLWCFERQPAEQCAGNGVEQGGALCDFPGCLRPAIRASLAVNAVGAFCCQEHWDLIERGNHNEKEAMEIAGARMNRKARSPKGEAS